MLSHRKCSPHRGKKSQDRRHCMDLGWWLLQCVQPTMSRNGWRNILLRVIAWYKIRSGNYSFGCTKWQGLRLDPLVTGRIFACTHEAWVWFLTLQKINKNKTGDKGGEGRTYLSSWVCAHNIVSPTRSPCISGGWKMLAFLCSACHRRNSWGCFVLFCFVLFLFSVTLVGHHKPGV